MLVGGKATVWQPWSRARVRQERWQEAIRSASPRLPACHTGPGVWVTYFAGSRGEAELLASCYRSCLTMAREHGCKTVDFPSISTGVYHFPLEQAAEIAISTIAEFLETAPELQQVRMVCFDERTKAHYDRALARLEGAK